MHALYYLSTTNPATALLGSGRAPANPARSLSFLREVARPHNPARHMPFVKGWHSHTKPEASLLFVREWHDHHTVHSSIVHSDGIVTALIVHAL